MRQTASISHKIAATVLNSAFGLRCLRYLEAMRLPPSHRKSRWDQYVQFTAPISVRK